MPKTSSSSPRSVVHATFCIERIYPASPAQVFKALTDPAAKAKWFTGGNGYTLLAREMDVRPGGREHVKGRWETGAFLDGYDDAGSRQHGSNLLLDALGNSLK
jgi:uncharacterized protein YndB with AHSA1/START domain